MLTHTNELASTQLVTTSTSSMAHATRGKAERSTSAATNAWTAGRNAK